MSTWLNLFGMQGFYQSDQIPIQVSGDGALTKITWTATDTSNNIVVQTSVSFNNGYDWTDWKTAIHGNFIPDIEPNTTLGSILLRYRVFLKTDSVAPAPLFSEIEFQFEPVIIFDNKGDSSCTPEVWITKTDNGDFSLQNISNNNEEFKFVDLINGETVYINNENQHIMTDLPTVYRYSNFNNNYLSIPKGKNVFKVKGNGKLQFRYQLKLI